ncbi:hypothetical protein Vadar_017810 [Vaccinium darrowii]|uniref:Uncharacterized protein n=1 Tax=Vaccinium darrowii TaxID=229202 RepID=A0ACB7Z705_9ERIC|nr:hypothetical protein Vadar_017810 [Vaccinium darrowii]
MADLTVVEYKERKDTPGIYGFRKVFGRIKDSRWRKKCKTVIKGVRSGLLIQKNKREAIIRQSQADIAQLLMNGQDDDALARVDQLHHDQHVLSAYNQIEIYCDTVHTNLSEIGSRSKLPYEVVEAVSSLVFAASRCGELPELHRIRTLLRKHFGNEFERNSVELQPGNFVNSQIKYNLGNNSVSDDMKLQITREIARECILCPQPDQITEVKPLRSLNLYLSWIWQTIIGVLLKVTRKKFDPRNGDSRDSNGNHQTQASKIKDESPTKEDGNERNKDKGLDSEEMSVRSNSNNVEKNFTQRHGASIKAENQMSDPNSKPRLGYVHPKLPDYDEVLATFTEYKREYLRDQNSEPRLSYVHPKLPDCDEVVATFTEYKREYLKRKPNDGTLAKLMGWFRK